MVMVRGHKGTGNLATGDLAWVMWQAVVWWPSKLAEGGGGGVCSSQIHGDNGGAVA